MSSDKTSTLGSGVVHDAPVEKGISRRAFLSTTGVAGLGAATMAVAGNAAAAETNVPAAGVSPPNAAQAALESDLPEGYSAELAHEYFVGKPGSDFMVDVIKHLGIDYMPINAAASYRGLHESLLNYGGNKPEILTCLHEEQATAMAHGYYKVTGKPLMLAFHGTVGLQHAAMAVYNAWCDRAPMIILCGNHLEATQRRPGLEWSHSAQDCVKVIRDYTKWDDTPLSLQHFAESMVQAYKIAMTPPMGPVAIVLEHHLQEEELGNQQLTIPALSPTVPPMGDIKALEEAARWLVQAENPVIVVDLMARNQEAVNQLVELAEALQAPVVNKFGRMNFPNTHYLSQPATVVGQADVILALELYDTYGTINSMRDRVERDVVRLARPDVKVIDIGVKTLTTKSNYQGFQRYYPSDLSIAGDGQTSLPVLIAAVRSAMSRARRATNDERKKRWQEAYGKARQANLQAMRYGWDSSPVSTGRLYAELWNQIKDRDWALVSEDGVQSQWARRLWPMEKHYQYIGSSMGYGLGYGAPSAVGAALAHRAVEGRLAVNVQRDGDMMYVPGVYWTAAHHKIPLLTVMHNNQAYHQEMMHVQRMTSRRQRGMDGNARIGCQINNPEIDFAMLVKGMGVWSAGPITDPNELGAVIKRALDVVDQGEPAFVDVRCQPR